MEAAGLLIGTESDDSRYLKLSLENLTRFFFKGVFESLNAAERKAIASHMDAIRVKLGFPNEEYYTKAFKDETLLLESV